MSQQPTDKRMRWLVMGTILGMAIAWYGPAEPAYASSATSGDKFSMCTVRTILGNSEAVFVLDSVTGRLLGAAYSTQTGTFTQFYARNLALDFKVADNAQYVMVSGDAQIRSTGSTAPAAGVVYVGELKSGIVAMYGFPYANSGRNLKSDLIAMDTFKWRGN